MLDPWLIRYARSRWPRLRLFCFPYAGGNAHIFRSWADELPDWIEVVGVQAPGKGSRVLEQPCTSIRELVDRLLESMQPLLHERPFCFFGHSNGALVSFELSCTLQKHRLPLPMHLLLSASPAPWTRVFETPYSQMTDGEFKASLEELNGTPQEILDHPELLDLFLPGLRADFSLSERYTYAHARKLDVPTTVLYGEFDEVELHQVHGWQDQIELPIQTHRIPGEHFFIHSHQKLVLDIIRNRLSGLVGAPWTKAEARLPWLEP